MNSEIWRKDVATRDNLEWFMIKNTVQKIHWCSVALQLRTLSLKIVKNRELFYAQSVQDIILPVVPVMLAPTFTANDESHHTISP